MSKKYVYSGGDHTILIPDSSLVWHDASADQSTLQYFDANSTFINDSTLNDVSYVTAIDSTDTSQYLSILENSGANETITLAGLDDLNVDSSPVEESHENLAEKLNLGIHDDYSEVIVFTLEGSNDLYGIQMTEDENGQIQKYQFKFRTNDEGQLELIPETVVLLPSDEEILENEQAIENDPPPDEDLELVQEDLDEEEKSTESKFEPELEEAVDPQEMYINLKSDNDVNILECMGSETTKISRLPIRPESTDQEIKQERYLEFEETINKDHVLEPQVAFLEPGSIVKAELADETDAAQLVQQYLTNHPHVEIEYDESELETNEESSEELLEDDATQVVPELVHTVSLGADSILKVPNQTLIDMEKHRNNNKIPSSELNYYVVYPEKENAILFENNTQEIETKNKNPRSVLKSTVDSSKEKKVKSRSDSEEVTENELFNKRFAKNREAVSAKNFHNFLNKTTITHAPVRLHRQPRKQKIKPIVERSREEIIVQEVIVSSNGYIENIKKNNHTKHQVTAIVELSDTDDDQDPGEKSSADKKRKRNSCNSESDRSIIEILSDKEPESEPDSNIQSIENNPRKSLKRRRGRPPKQIITRSQRLSAAPETKRELICPHCPKTFPSQNSLNTHLIHHNLENKYKTRMSTKVEYNHLCDQCNQRFKNQILLKKHECPKKSVAVLTCTVCMKRFKDITVLNMHKKSHNKTALVKNTTTVTVTPKRMPTRSSSLKIGKFKCVDCPRVFDSDDKLTTHMKIHKKFQCATCTMTFNSKLLLDTHIRTTCVKVKNKSTSRLSQSVCSRKSSLNQSILGVKLDCDQCSQKFVTFRTLYAHKVKTHGMSTPDKNLLLDKPKQRLYKPIRAHAGIPANKKLQKAYEEIRKKMSETGNISSFTTMELNKTS